MINLQSIPPKLKSLWYFLPLIILGVFYTWKSIYAPIADFGNYYYGGVFILDGYFNPDIYFPEFFNSKIYDITQQYTFLSFAPNAPFSALIFIPLTLLSLPVAKLIFNLVSLTLFLYAIYQLNSSYPISKLTLLLLPLIFLVPIKNQIMFGQLYFILFFLLVMGFLAYKNEKWVALSMFWGVAICLKIFPVLLLGILLLNGKIKAFIYLVLSTSTLVVITVLFTGWETNYYFFTEVLLRANGGEIAGNYVDNYQSVYMFLKRLFLFHPVENNSSWIDLPLVFKPSILAFKIFIVTILTFLTWKTKNQLLLFSIWILASLLLTAYGSTYSLLLLIPLVWSVTLLKIPLSFKVVFYFLLGLAANSVLLPVLIFPFNYVRMFSLLLIFMGLAFHFRVSIPLKTVALGTILIALISFLFFPQNEGEKYATSFSMPILSYDYILNDNTLTYSYWNMNGPQKQTIPFEFTSQSTSNVAIVSNQVYYKNTPLTFNHSNKKDVRIINGNQILYLSDEGRGIGFYQLRKIDIEK